MICSSLSLRFCNLMLDEAFVDALRIDVLQALLIGKFCDVADLAVVPTTLGTITYFDSVQPCANLLFDRVLR